METDREFLRLDLIWYLDLPSKSFLELALEHENHRHLKPSVLEEVDKLRHVKAYKKLVIYYPWKKDIERDLSVIADYALSAAIEQNPREQWLVLTLTDDSDKWDAVGASLFALLPDKKWQHVANRSLTISYKI